MPENTMIERMSVFLRQGNSHGLTFFPGLLFHFAKGKEDSGQHLAHLSMSNTWAPDSWKMKPLAQGVGYPNRDLLRQAQVELAELPPLVTSGEVDTLKTQLAEAHAVGVSCSRAAIVVSGLTTVNPLPSPAN